MDDAFAVSRMREIRLSGSMRRGPAGDGDDGPLERDTHPKGEKQPGLARPDASTAPAPDPTADQGPSTSHRRGSAHPNTPAAWSGRGVPKGSSSR